MRAAMMTANLMAMQTTKPIEQDQFSEMIKSLSHYLPDVSDYEEVDDMLALKLLQSKR